MQGNHSAMHQRTGLRMALLWTILNVILGLEEIQNPRVPNPLSKMFSPLELSMLELRHDRFSKQYRNTPTSEDVPMISEVLLSEVTGTPAQDSGQSNYRNRERVDDFFAPLLVDDLRDFSALTNATTNCTHNDSLVDCARHAPTFRRSTLTKVVVLLVIAAVSLVGNAATLASILRTRRQSTSTVYMLLVQLALADVLVTVFCIVGDALWTLTVQWRAGDALCKGLKFMQMFSLYLSTFVLVLIGFDRLSAVRFPMQRAHAKHHVRNGIAFVWALSALLSVPQCVIFRVVRGPFVEEFHQCVTYGFYTAQWQEQLYTTLSLVLMFLLPLLVLIATYICTFCTIASQENMFSERITRTAIDDARRKILHKAKVKSLMITVVIVLAFVVCWTPYYVTMIIFIFMDPGDQLSEDLQSAIFFFGSSTAMINPLIYGAFHLRRRKQSSRKSTSVNNNSSSSRVEHSLMTTLKKGHPRKSREESTCLTYSPPAGSICRTSNRCYLHSPNATLDSELL